MTLVAIDDAVETILQQYPDQLESYRAACEAERARQFSFFFTKTWGLLNKDVSINDLNDALKQKLDGAEEIKNE